MAARVWRYAALALLVIVEPLFVDGCPATCNGTTCDYWDLVGWPCSYNEDVNGCDCTGCLCNLDSDDDNWYDDDDEIGSDDDNQFDDDDGGTGKPLPSRTPALSYGPPRTPRLP